MNGATVGPLVVAFSRVQAREVSGASQGTGHAQVPENRAETVKYVLDGEHVPEQAGS